VTGWKQPPSIWTAESWPLAMSRQSAVNLAARIRSLNASVRKHWHGSNVQKTNGRLIPPPGSERSSLY
jgi:hypothetical protein